MKNPITAFIDKKLQKFDPIWQAENGKGGQRSRFYDKTGIAKYREWRGVHDTMVDYLAWLNNLKSMGLMVASAPLPVLKGMWEYRWMGSYLGTFAFIDRLFEGYRGPELKIAHLNMHAIVQSLTKKIALVLSNDRRLGGGPLSDKHGADGRGAAAPLHVRLPEPHPDTAADPAGVHHLRHRPAARALLHRRGRELRPRGRRLLPLLGRDGRHLQRRLPAHRQGLAFHEHALQRQRGHEHVPAPPHRPARLPRHARDDTQRAGRAPLLDAGSARRDQVHRGRVRRGLRLGRPLRARQADERAEHDRAREVGLLQDRVLRPLRHSRDALPPLLLGQRQRPGGLLHQGRPQGHKDNAPLLREEVYALRRQDPPPRLPLGPERGVLHRLPDLDAELLGRQTSC